MTTFQILLLVVSSLLLLLTLYSLVSTWPARRYQMFWALLWLTAIVASIWPDATTRIATRLGIQRGKDLLLYCGMMFMLVGFFMIYARLRTVRRELTLLVRRLAILEAEKTTDGRTTPTT